MGYLTSVSLLRVRDSSGTSAVAACLNGDIDGVMGLGEPEGWLSVCHDEPSVILDTDDVVQLTNPADVRALAAWLSAAAVWLQVQLLEEKHS